MKEYTSYRREDHYKKETDNFRKLCRKEKKCPLGLVEYLGAYQHGDKCHMLLEFADGGTLAEVLATEQPPMDGDEILRFWEQKLRLLDALTRIHQLENSSVDEDGKPVKYLGYVCIAIDAQLRSRLTLSCAVRIKTFNLQIS